MRLKFMAFVSVPSVPLFPSVPSVPRAVRHMSTSLGLSGYVFMAQIVTAYSDGHRSHFFSSALIGAHLFSFALIGAHVADAGARAI